MRILFFFFFVFSAALVAHAQDDFLAQQYYSDGEFSKAQVFYERLVAQNPRRSDYAENLVRCYQQQEKYAEAEEFLSERIANGNPYPTIFIDLGYNYRLQQKMEEAEEYYKKALASIEKNPNYGYGVGIGFQRYAVLDYALRAYERAMELNPQLDYNFQMAQIYGEQGNVEKMFTSYLQLLRSGRYSKANVLGKVNDFISEDPAYINNNILKKILIQKAQKSPDILWNELLSWLFVQQKQYGSAFNQEKGIYRRTEGATMERIENLGSIALDDNAISEAQEIYKYILKNSPDSIIRLNAQLNLIDIDLRNADDKKLSELNTLFQELITTYGYKTQSLQLQVAYANFLTFRRGESETAITILKKSLQLPLAKYGEAYLKMALADILVFDQKFNEALIYFSQIQKSLKNDVLGQDARFKIAQTSFYKGDFEWALIQLKVLRGSTSQLIANDAMQLSLLISDNSLEDSTQTALKKYAKADLLAYQNKTKEAISTLEGILQNHKGEKIEDEALLRQGQLLEKEGDYEGANFNYLKIIEFYGDDILADDAHFSMAEVFRKQLNKPQKAMYHYERILYNYQDSYFFPQARKNFRLLRGDSIN
ncbi:MAG: tetratricopeptide repeat protein [Eudoraea sp.]|nr:tetratricopeptide repeat protein [Eudoraea sp.]